LIYLGTFFSVMETNTDFSGSIPSTFTKIPYKWHISFPGGAIIERLASSHYPRELSRQGQIELFLRAAEEAAQQGLEPLRIRRMRWRIGKSASNVPHMRTGARENFSGQIALAPIHTFAEAVRDLFRNAKKRNVRVAGGLSKHKWICRYIEDIANLHFENTPAIYGAEGAALLAAERMFVKNGFRSEL
jgi:hypothetical protein